MALSFFLRLLLGHVIGDFVLQPFWLVLAKRNGWVGLIVHVSVVTFITAIFAWGVIPGWWVWMIVLFLGHLFIDQFRTFVFTDNSKGKGLLLFYLDQLAHVVLIVIIAWLATSWSWADLMILTEDTLKNEYRLVTYLIGIGIMIGVVPVIEVETAVFVLSVRGTEIKKTVKIDGWDRGLGALERISALFFIVTGYGLLAPLVFLPRLALMIYHGDAKENSTMVITKVAMSFLTALIVSLFLINVPIPIFLT